ncbi:MAG: CPBP family intramembrane metalloprotease [Pirellulales bacterium]|nr:CPBP family intramembrane metalloprotease [Pirellulales bacterium]
MNWTNVKLILLREVRDQMRDRRTMFMIFVLPILLYPFLGMTFFQVSQFVRQHSTDVLVLGFEELPPDQRLIEADTKQFRPEYFGSIDQAALLKLHFPETPDGADAKKNGTKDASPLQTASSSTTPDARMAAAENALRDGTYEVVLLFPAGFGEKLAHFREELASPGANPQQAPAPPEAEVLYNSAKERSLIAFARVSDVLREWRDSIREENLAQAAAQHLAASPLDIETVDVAPPDHRDAAVWSKVFPFLLVIWALTGAFYPAVDLCAGEKERGTLETLLSSPAERTEIVWGKLLTIMLFSISTVILNIASMAITGTFILSQLEQFGAPPISALGWLFVALVPVSALFSALCLALAAFAKSSKEGQYYLMPLLLVTMPLVVLPISPAVELNLGNSLVPITGIVLLLKAVLEGNHWQALPFVPPVVAVTLGCCLLAIRWAVDQFNSESVLFREGERFQLKAWFRHLLRDREATPSVSEAIFCGVLILLIRFFLSFAASSPESFHDFMSLALVSQLVVIATPALFMTIMLTRSPRETLLLHAPPWATVPAAALLALSLHPVVLWFQQSVIQRLYPLNPEIAQALEGFMSEPGTFWQLLIVVAIVPPLCEELAFRGFILSGLRHLGHKWRAIVISSIFFGLAHALLQQSIVASLVGMVLGYLAVQCGSLLPPILYHMLHNGLALGVSRVTHEALDEWPVLRLLYVDQEGTLIYRWPVVVIGAAVAALVLYWLHRRPYVRTAEERLEESIERHAGRGLTLYNAEDGNSDDSRTDFASNAHR